MDGKPLYVEGIDTRRLFHVERSEGGQSYFAIRDAEPRFAFTGKTISEVAALAEKGLALMPGRHIIERAEWDALIAEHRRLQEQLARYTLPAQRGARNRTKAKLDEMSRKIRAVDAVIGIDAWEKGPK